MDAVASAATAGELVMAWREIGKLLGAYEPEKRILEIRDYSQAELKTVSDKDLLSLAGGKMQEVIDGDFKELDGSVGQEENQERLCAVEAAEGEAAR